MIWQAATRVMNPCVTQAYIDAEYEKDPVSAAAEFGAQFRTDIESFVSREAIEAATDWGVHEREPLSGKRYVAFVDPSGGSADSFTLAVAHSESQIAVLDCMREVRPPFSPEAVVEEFCDLLKCYSVTKVKGDRYAGEWPREQFAKRGIKYEPAEDPKGILYLNLLPHINSGKVRLLGNKRLVTQLIGLERRTSRAGRDSIDHAPGGHDDVANAAAVLCSLRRRRSRRCDSALSTLPKRERSRGTMRSRRSTHAFASLRSPSRKILGKWVFSDGTETEHACETDVTTWLAGRPEHVKESMR